MVEEAPGSEDQGPDEDVTLGGYFSVHNRPPAFDGCDGHPYTVSIETERLPDLRDPVGVYLVFPRWATTGVGIVGHVETGILRRGPTASEVRSQVESLSLLSVQRLLNHVIVEGSGSVGIDGLSSVEPSGNNGLSEPPETDDLSEPPDQP